MIQLDDLPEEVLLLVFGYLPTSDLLNNVGTVCRKWSRLTNDHRLYGRVLIDDKLRQEAAVDLLKRHVKRVLHVELKRRNDVNHILPFIAGCSNLRSLKIVACQGQVRTLKPRIKQVTAV